MIDGDDLFYLKFWVKATSLERNRRFSSCRAFTGLTTRAKIIGGGRPFLPEILSCSDRVGAKSLFFDLFSLVAPQP